MAARATTDLPLTDLADPVMFSNPFPRYAELRRTAPVSRALYSAPRRTEVFMLTRYDEIMRVHTDPVFSSDPLKAGSSARLLRFAPRMFKLMNESMVYKDDPEHKRLRGLVSRAFTPKRIERMQDDIQRLVDGFVDDLAAKSRVDLVEDFAVPLPLAVISSMLGIPDRDRDQFHEWARGFSDLGAGGAANILRALPMGTKMVKMFDRLARERRVEPDDGLITALVQANIDGDELDGQEIVSMIFLLLLAGHDTTSNLIGSSILALLENPDQLERLRAEPELIDTAIEELLRYTTPVPVGAVRVPQDDVELGGVEIPKGRKVIAMLISANRDEGLFDDPEELDLARAPNKHITFAFGSHYCLGNQLARLEGKLALQALVQRFEDISLAVPREALRWKPMLPLRGVRELPLVLS